MIGKCRYFNQNHQPGETYDEYRQSIPALRPAPRRTIAGSPVFAALMPQLETIDCAQQLYLPSVFRLQ